jgi:hypothetical protein
MNPMMMTTKMLIAISISISVNPSVDENNFKCFIFLLYHYYGLQLTMTLFTTGLVVCPVSVVRMTR